MRFLTTAVALGSVSMMALLAVNCGGDGDGGGDDNRDVIVRGVATLPAQLGSEPVANAPCQLADLQADPRGTTVVDEVVSDDTGVWSMRMNRSALAEVRCTTNVEQVQGSNLKVRGLAIPDDPAVPPGQPVVVQKNVDGVTTVGAVAGLGTLQQGAQEQALRSSDGGDGSRGQTVRNQTASDFTQEQIGNLEEAARRRISNVDFTNEDSINSNAEQVINDTDGGSALCGNGVVEEGEECDDGDTRNGDGCDSNCRREPEPTPTPSEGQCGDFCCDGRDDGCTPPGGGSCRCDEHCGVVGDCCPDFDGVCGSCVDAEGACQSDSDCCSQFCRNGSCEPG